MNRRTFLRNNSIVAGAALAAAALPSAANDPPSIVIDPAPQFEISPYLYMQFMEPLGVTDSSVAAAWDYGADDWRRDFVDLTRDLAPGVLRFGGLYSRYYKWREGVGPAKARPWTRNYVWGGWESNRVGTHEFVDLCRRVGAEPLYCVNFLSDGHREFWRTSGGQDRSGDAAESADWVGYANDPDHAERKRNGAAAPLKIKLWQLGNETSYGEGGFTKDESIRRTLEFARAMKQRDPSVRLIGWGDRHHPDEDLWAGDLLREAGENLDFVAIHMMGQHPRRSATVLAERRWESSPEQAWEELLELTGNVEKRISELDQVIKAGSSSAGIAVTEGHLSLPPANTSPLLREWLTGVYHARSMNIYQRHGDRVKIATAADFNGTRWTSNALMTPVPAGKSYLLPAGSVMRLFKRHNGAHSVAVKSCPADLDVAASRTNDRYFLHVANLSYRSPVQTSLVVDGVTLSGGRVFSIAPGNLREYVDQDRPDVFAAEEHQIAPAPGFAWTFPAGSVTAVELQAQP
jgi:alpha-L-arabinofuranosidase